MLRETTRAARRSPKQERTEQWEHTGPGSGTSSRPPSSLGSRGDAGTTATARTPARSTAERAARPGDTKPVAGTRAAAVPPVMRVPAARATVARDRSSAAANASSSPAIPSIAEAVEKSATRASCARTGAAARAAPRASRSATTSVSIPISTCATAVIAAPRATTGRCAPTECATRSGASRCVNPLRDRWNCGDCGVACGPGYLCSAGVCALSCQVELVECDGLCVDPLKDRDYCGAATGCATGNESAGQICEEGSVCSAGSCGLTCAEGLIQCGDSCVDPARDLAFCGASGDCSGSTTGAACGSGERCAEGACELACPTGQLVCAGRCVDRLKDREYCGATLGCGEESVGSDGTSCGDGDVCSNGTCAPSCQDGLIECDGQCVDPLRDRAHCGVDAECQPNPNAAPICAPGYVCNGGECSLSCPSVGVKCGSECVDPTKDIEHCGATAGCGENGVGSDGTECAPGHVCSFGICMPSCQDGLVECNGTCIVPERDREFCGATPGCGVDGGDDGETCPPGYVCNGGDCSLSCPDNLVNCAGVCTDPQVDRDHCGATAGCGFGEGSAGDSCSPGYVCNAGQCSLL